MKGSRWLRCLPALVAGAGSLQTSGFEKFVDFATSPSKVRLLETPKVPSDATSMALARVELLCNKCGKLIVPDPCLTRVTVSKTPYVPQMDGAPSDPDLTARDRIWQDSAWTDCIEDENVSFSQDRAIHLMRAAKDPYTEPMYFRKFKCVCGLPLGYRLENKAGDTVSPSGEVGRSHKLVFFNEKRGFVLQLADPAAWAIVPATLPTQAVKDRQREPRHLEVALELPSQVRLYIETSVNGQ